MKEDRRIMILGAGEGQIPLISRAKREGWKTVVVSPKGDYPGFAIADECRFYDIADKYAILELVKREGITAIATDQTDVSISSVLFVAKELGLPSIDCENIDNFRIKSCMRDTCRDCGLPTIPYCVTDSFDTALSFYQTLPDGLVIIKPVDSQGSRGVQKISSKDELSDAFGEARKYSPSKRIILEQFVIGQEIEVDTVIYDGKVLDTLIGDVHNFEVRNTFSAYIREYPTRLSSADQDRIRNLNAKVVCAFGLRTGWTHGEYMITADKDVYLLEVGARGGGNFIGSDIVRTMLGVSTDEMAFDTAIGDLSFYKRVHLRDSYCAYRCFYLPEGEVVSVDIAQDFLQQPFVLTHNLDKLVVGAKTHKNTDKTSRYTIVIKEDSREHLQQRLKEIEKSITVRVRTSSGVQGIIWN